MAGELHDAAVRREVAAQDREPAGRLQRRLDRDDDLLARRLDDGGRDLGERAAVDVRRVAVHEAGLQQLARDERDAAGGMQVGRDEAAARLDVGDDRRARRDAVELVDRQVDAELVRDREQMQHAVRRAAGRGDRGDRVLDRVTRDHLRRPRVVADELHRDAPGFERSVVLRRIGRGDVVQPGGADAEELERPSPSCSP